MTESERNNRLLARYRRPEVSRQDLEIAARYAIKEGNREYAAEIRDIYNLRFNKDVSAESVLPRDKIASCVFRDESRIFPSAKKAYIWLVEQMLDTVPEMDIEDYTLGKMFIHGTRGAQYLVASPAKFLAHGSSRTANPSYYHKLSNGWFLYTTLSDKQKREKLFSLAAVCEICHSDWSWHDDKAVDDALESFDEIVKELKLLNSKSSSFVKNN